MTAVVPPVAGVSSLCREGDTLLETGELESATALYLSAFRTHATSTVAHMRKLNSGLSGVITTLEGWLHGSGETRLPPPSLNKGLAAVFLSTLCPNNLSATIFKMESLLQSGGQVSEEIFERCTALLEGKQNCLAGSSTHLMLELTRALSCLFSESHSTRGLRLYLNVYRRDESETVRLVKSRQAQHIPKIVKTFTDRVLHKHRFLDHRKECTVSAEDKLGDETCSSAIEFLSALSPSSREVQELKAVHLFMTGRFGESAQVYTSLLELCSPNTPNSSSDKSFPDTPEGRAALLTGRAAACLSAGGRSAEACSDLGEAFQTHPATARLYFQKLFADRGTALAARSLLRQQAERGLSAFKERVLVRPDLRSTDGTQLLDPAIARLRTLCHLEPYGGGRELRVRLADCLLLRGEHREALSICSQLAASQGQQSYQNTVQVLRGYARFLCDDHKGASEDFQAVIEHSAPHPPSCVRALCGRGLLRMMNGSSYLTAVDYVTASGLQLQETALTVRCLVPWNCRGLLCTVLAEQGRVMLEGAGQSTSGEPPRHQPGDQLATPSKRDKPRSGFASPAGVHSLALLLMDLQPGADGPQVLAADALYQLGRVEEAYRLLLSVGPAGPRAAVLARLALLQLHRGFLYDTNQVCGAPHRHLPWFLKTPPFSNELLCLRPAAAEETHPLRRHQLPDAAAGGGQTEGPSAAAGSLSLRCQTHPGGITRRESPQRGRGVPLYRHHGLW